MGRKFAGHRVQEWLFHHAFYLWQVQDSWTRIKIPIFILRLKQIRDEWRFCHKWSRIGRYHWFGDFHDWEEGKYPLQWSPNLLDMTPWELRQIKCKACGKVSRCVGYSDAQWAAMFDVDANHMEMGVNLKVKR